MTKTKYIYIDQKITLPQSIELLDFAKLYSDQIQLSRIVEYPLESDIIEEVYQEYLEIIGREDQQRREKFQMDKEYRDELLKEIARNPISFR